MEWTHVTYQRKSLLLKVLAGLLLCSMAAAAFLFSDWGNGSRFIHLLWTSFLVIALVFFLIMTVLFLFFMCKPRKTIFLSYNEQGILVKDLFIPFEEVKDIRYGLNPSDVRTYLIQGFTIKRHRKNPVIIPTYQTLLDKEAFEQALEPLEQKRAARQSTMEFR
ncbi:DUF5381 family protein [Fictibacillus fluitans]|uniref:DUF5381 family protein n=1 Tax=Fictibacillus fluitans TaxID=3058422 RepID=A0ABT8I0E7_9BACL|nr:DUF5381 family protein [Fictibacillus sp. NE201]MDN4526480.1 DUF5381 family protein [Fictibacillus sp. NE201]